MSRRRDEWFPWYPGDYARDTGHLTTLQHGIYRLLLDASWVRGGTLPNDMLQLAAAAKMSARAFGKEWTVVGLFFRVDGKLLVSKRMSEEHGKAIRISEMRAASGAKGGRPKKATEKANGKQTETPAGKINTLPTEDIGKKRSPAEPSKKVVASPAAQPGTKGTRLPMVWYADEGSRAYAAGLGFTDDQITEMEIDFTTWWPAQPGQKGLKTDWNLTWKTWVRTEAKRHERDITPAERKARDRISNYQRAVRTPAAPR